MLAGRLCSGGSMKPDEFKKRRRNPLKWWRNWPVLNVSRRTSILSAAHYFLIIIYQSIYLSVFPLEALNWHSYGQITAFQNGKSTIIPVHGFRMPVDQMLTPTLSNPLTITHRYSVSSVGKNPTISKSYVFPAFPAINLRFSQDHPRHRWRGSGRTRVCWGRAPAASASCCAHRPRCRWWSTTPGTSAWHRGHTVHTELARKLTVVSTVNGVWPMNKSGKWKPNETYPIFDILCY